MMKIILLISMMLIQISLISGCAQGGDQNTPALAGNTQYPGAVPPPGRIQQNNAINAQTMIAPVRP